MTLRQRLDAGLRFDAEYGRSLANHLPMALIALDRLGALDDRLAVFEAAYSRQLEPARAAQPWPDGQPLAQRLGDAAAWPAYRTMFRDWLARDGAAAVLAAALPELMPGCGAAAFHGLIRTSHAVRAGHDGELADGLAYWAARFLPLDGSVSASGQRLIVDRMQDAAALPGFEAEVAEAQARGAALETLARDAAGLYARSGNFTVLHLVTSGHALRMLLDHVDDVPAAIGAYRRAVVAGRHAARAVAGEPAAMLPWAVLVAAACTTDDEHLVKLVDSCREEERAYGGSEWQLAASRAVADARRGAG